MRRSRCPLLFPCFRLFKRRLVEASGGICRNWAFGEKSHNAASESGIFLGHGSICCALISPLPWIGQEAEHYAEEKSPENDTISVAPRG